MCYAVFSRSEVDRHVYLLRISWIPSWIRCCFSLFCEFLARHLFPSLFLTVISSLFLGSRYISSPVFPVRHGIERRCLSGPIWKEIFFLLLFLLFWGGVSVMIAFGQEIQDSFFSWLGGFAQ